MERGIDQRLFIISDIVVILLDPKIDAILYYLTLSQTRTLIDRLQKLVSSDGRFKNMRDALRW